MINPLRVLPILILCSVATACGGSEPTAQAPTNAASTPAAPGGPAAPAAGAPIANADAVIATMKPDFRKCFEAAQQKDPKAAGKVMVVAKVGPTGEVTSATAQDATLPAEAADCIAKRVKSAKFDPPGPAGSTLNVPVSFDAGK